MAAQNVTIRYDSVSWAIWFGGGMTLNAGAFFSNLALILTIIASDDLRKQHCNKLLMNLGIADLIATCASSHSLINGYEPIFKSNVSPMTSADCFANLGYGVFSLTVGSMGMLSISLDRLIAVWLPMTYKNLPSSYVWVAVSVSWASGTSIFVMGYLTRSSVEMRPFCVTPLSLSVLGMSIWNKIMITVNVAVIMTNFGTWLKIKLHSSGSNSVDPTMKRIMSTVLIIASVYITAWVSTTAIIMLATNVGLSLENQFACLMWVAWLSIINQGSNFSIYLSRSSQYRDATKKLFKVAKSGAVEPQMTVQVATR